MRRKSGMRRFASMHPIDAQKNMVDLDTTTATISVTVVQLAIASKPGNVDELTQPIIVPANASIKSLYVEYFLYNRSGNLPGQEKITILIRKNEQGLLPAPTLAQVNAIGLQTWKNRVFAIHRAKPPAPGGLPLIMGSIKIPRRFHKMQTNDVWELIIANNGSGSVDGCGICIYKSYL